MVGKKGDESTARQGASGKPISISIVMDGCAMVGPSPPKDSLPKRVMSGTRDADGVLPEVEEDPGQPFPISLVHGEQKSGMARLDPGIAHPFQGIQIQGGPTIGRDPRHLQTSVAEKSTGEVPRKWTQDRPTQLANLLTSGNWNGSTDQLGTGLGNPLFGCRSKGKVDSQGIRGWDLVGHDEKT